jgi:hypothetical protein
MGRHKKPNATPLTTVAVSLEVAEAINKFKIRGETQSQALARLLKMAFETPELVSERNEWECEAKQWEQMYRDLEQSTTRRIQILENEFKQQVKATV